MNFELEWNCLERIRGQLPTCDSDIGGSAPVHQRVKAIYVGVLVYWYKG
jgi:hypothetical protein